MNQRTCSAKDQNCTTETIQHDLVSERTATAVRNIVSGENDCGTLIGKDGRVNQAHLDQSIRGVMQTYEDEAEMLRADRARISAESEERRQALECVYSNDLGKLTPDVGARVCKVLGFAN